MATDMSLRRGCSHSTDSRVASSDTVLLSEAGRLRTGGLLGYRVLEW